MRGTEILSPLQFVLMKPPLEGYARQVFVLTDGEVRGCKDESTLT